MLLCSYASLDGFKPSPFQKQSALVDIFPVWGGSSVGAGKSLCPWCLANSRSARAGTSTQSGITQP